MNIETNITRTCEVLPYSREIIAKTIKSYNDYLEKSINAVQKPNISVPYIGTFFVDKTKFFRKILRSFVQLRRMKDRLKLLEDTKGIDNQSYRTYKIRYDRLSIEFRKLWRFKQEQGWNFTFSTSKNKKNRGYFEDSYKQKEARDKKFAS